MHAEAETEQSYAVPSHLKASGSIGIIPDRTFYVGLGTLVLAALPAYVGWAHLGWQGVLFGVPVVLLGTPFMAWWLDPPAEHGLVHFVRHLFRRRTLRPQHIASLRDLRIDGDTMYPHSDSTECVAILQMPTVNLDLASVASRRRHRRQLGLLLDGISTHRIQVLVRAESVSVIGSIERMRLNRNAFARRLADWLAKHHHQERSIDRRRYLIIPATDPEMLFERVDTISRSFRQAGLEPQRLSDPADLRDLINSWWTWRPHPERLGPETVVRPANYLQTDGEFLEVWALGKVPSTITTNWWYRLLDADLAADMSMTVEQQNLSLAKWKLDLRYNNLAASIPSPARRIALAQIEQLRLGFENRVRPWDVQVLFVVRGSDKASLDRNSKRLQQQVRDLGGQVNLLKWEQSEGMQAAQPTCQLMMPARQLYLESGTLARTTPFSASTLQMLDGVPWGEAGSTPIMLTTTGSGIMGRHFGWYGKPGAGKGFGVRCYLARRHFADRLRLFLWDTDEAQHEYAGRFTEFLQGVRLELHTLADVQDVQLDPRWQVIAFDVSGMDRSLRSQAFARVTRLVEQHVLAFPGPSAFVIDEATEIAEDTDQTGALALGHAVQIWRKWGIEVHVITQRVSDWFRTTIGRKIQGNLAVKWYGAQEDAEMYEVSRRLHLSPEETDRITSAGIGEGLLDAFGRRVWANLYDQCSPDEIAAYSTDPPERAEVLATPRVVSTWGTQQDERVV